MHEVLTELMDVMVLMASKEFQDHPVKYAGFFKKLVFILDVYFQDLMVIAGNQVNQVLKDPEGILGKVA